MYYYYTCSRYASEKFGKIPKVNAKGHWRTIEDKNVRPTRSSVLEKEESHGGQGQQNKEDA